MAVIFQAAVWLRLAECLNSLGEVERAVDAYSRVVEMAPSHIEARMSLPFIYSIILILTDGEIHDMQKTIDIIY